MSGDLLVFLPALQWICLLDMGRVLFPYENLIVKLALKLAKNLFHGGFWVVRQAVITWHSSKSVFLKLPFPNPQEYSVTCWRYQMNPYFDPYQFHIYNFSVNWNEFSILKTMSIEYFFRTSNNHFLQFHQKANIGRNRYHSTKIFMNLW